MRIREPDELRRLAGDIEIDLSRVAVLEKEIQRAQAKIDEIPACADLFYESLALKLQSFYTGCEKIFSLIATELNGGLPKGADWHRQLLDRMKKEQQERKAVVTPQTAEKLKDFLSFRHVVRNIYGFELNVEKLDELLAKYPATWASFERDIAAFVNWLKDLAISLDV